MKRVLLTCATALVLQPALAQMMTPSYQGLWWKSPAASESGWGLNITHQGDILFATWFTYDANGDGMWLVIPNANRLPGDDDPYYGMSRNYIEYTGTIYRTRGPAFNAAVFDPAAVTVTPVGDASLRFTSEDAGTFAYSVNGVMQSKAITRQVFSTMPTCDFGAPGATPNFQDLWWRSPAGSESGWGVNIAHQGDIIFATWFTYGSDGRGVWLVMSEGRRTGANTFTGALYRTRGPAYDAQVWNASQVSVTPAGTGTFTFGDANNGTFQYTVDGVSQSKSITRQVFAAPKTSCR